jgi:hypothetical protein
MKITRLLRRRQQQQHNTMIVASTRTTKRIPRSPIKSGTVANDAGTSAVLVYFGFCGLSDSTT